jgi:hypothetical protein
MMRDADKMPIMEHEVRMTSSDAATSLHVGNVAYGGRKPAYNKLAILSVIIFVSAFVFLMLFLVTPIFFSLNHPKGQHSPAAAEHDVHVHSNNGSTHEHTHSTEDEEDRDKREVRPVEQIHQLMTRLCGCDVMNISKTNLENCLRNCFHSVNNNKNRFI